MDEDKLSDRFLLDKVADAFEAAWRAKDAPRPRIEDFINRPDVTPSVREKLLIHLIQIEVEWRVKAGEVLLSRDYDSYMERFPEIAEWLRSFFAATWGGWSYAGSSQVLGSPSVLKASEYKPLREVGQGGMGVVFEAEQVLPSGSTLRVAIKVILPGKVNADMRHRFSTEIDVCSNLVHPHLVRLLSAGEYEGELFMVLEWLTGSTVDTLVQEHGALAFVDACKIIRDAALGLAYAHGQGVTHRDIKPSNLFQTSEGVVKVLDFGLATIAGGVRLSSVSGLSGTPAYMAPEARRGGVVDHRADLYGLGLVFHFLLTASNPSNGRPVVDLPQGMPQPLVELINGLLKENPDERLPRSAAVLAAQLTAFISLKASPSNLGAVKIIRSKFYGREADMERVRWALVNEGQRLVTIKDTGGSGKTAFALEVAWDLRPHFQDAVYFVELKDQELLEEVCFAVAQALRQEQRLSRATDPASTVAEILRQLPGPSLLVLDNFEHLRHHALKTVVFWLAQAANVQMLLTSRRALDLEGVSEKIHDLPPLPLPPVSGEDFADAAQLLVYPAVLLFVTTARSEMRSFAFNPRAARLVVQLCRALHGLPLPIILVAKRAATLTLEKMVETLNVDTLPMAGEKLWQTINWSYRLLLPGQSQAFVEACVFRDGFDLEAAQAVLHMPPDTVLPLLTELCRVSLLERRPDGRYWMFNTIRDFGRHQWVSDPATPPADWRRKAAKPPSSLGQRWAKYYLGKAKNWNGSIYGLDCVQAMKRLDEERANILGAHAWALEEKEMATAAGLILAYTQALELRGPWDVRVARLTQTKDLLEHGDEAMRARLFVELAHANRDLGDLEQGLKWAGLALETIARLADPHVGALARWERGEMLHLDGRNEEALDLLEKALLNLVGPEDQVRGALLRCRLAYIYARFGKFTEARDNLVTARGVAEQTKSPILHARCEHRLGYVFWFEGRPEEAERHTRKALRLSHETSDLRGSVGAAINLSLVLTDLGQYAEAEVCLEKNQPDLERLGGKTWQALALGSRGLALLLQGDLDRAESDLRNALQLAQEVAWKEDQAFHLGNLGRLLLCRREKIAQAAEYLKSAKAIHEEIDGCHQNDRGHRRYFGNLVNLAQAQRWLGKEPEVGPLITRADALAGHLNLGDKHPVRMVRDDFALLRTLQGN